MVRKKKKIKTKILKKKKPIKKTSLTQKSSSTEDKVEIKKIKKQPTEKRIYNVNDHVVYPKDGVGKIVSIEKALIGGIESHNYKIDVLKDKLTLQLPINMQSLLRPVSSTHQINKYISILKSKPKVKRTMWSRRAQEYEQKITSGKIYELAEVVRDLNKNTNTIADQSYSERQLFEKAYDRLESEFEVVLNLPTEEVKKKMNKALGREEKSLENE